ncbi:hypothetical protein ATN84_16205 [Paramesorhizobium deserti]|uniref:2,4-dihydroxyhept-2-ene-1,7-dioic acid aldolase n=1 Tax=Paramesorhizobium deserti TaxID=1494590 RepID=A0A135HT89_9HYPH|nr:DUF2218 domain-containing protein [Paramesorhizobium deserti]KXF76411.1 hypothetical protein ATN84_16205 [Paramesorhizobium deserti]
MLTATARCRTPHADKYIQQLCKHFGHKIEAVYADGHGECCFSCGTAIMDADLENLEIRVEAADAEGLKDTKHVIESHLIRFAFRENMPALAWQG